MTLAMSSPWVVRLSMRASIRPRRSSFSTSAPPSSTARPSEVQADDQPPQARAPGPTEFGPRRPGPGHPPFRLGCGLRSTADQDLAVAVADAIQGLDGVELGIDLAELLAHPLDVAVDGAVVDIDLIVVGGVHQVVAALHEAGALGQRTAGSRNSVTVRRTGLPSHRLSWRAGSSVSLPRFMILELAEPGAALAASSSPDGPGAARP